MHVFPLREGRSEPAYLVLSGPSSLCRDKSVSPGLGQLVSRHKMKNFVHDRCHRCQHASGWFPWTIGRAGPTPKYEFAIDVVRMLHICMTFFPIFTSTNLSPTSSLLELAPTPSALDILARDRPNLSRARRRASNRAANHVDHGTDLCLFLVKVSNLVDVDLEDGHPGVFGSARVNPVALVAEPGFGGGRVELLDNLVIGDDAGVSVSVEMGH
jgi:hypothetical protein